MKSLQDILEGRQAMVPDDKGSYSCMSYDSLCDYLLMTWDIFLLYSPTDILYFNFENDQKH